MPSDATPDTGPVERFTVSPERYKRFAATSLVLFIVIAVVGAAVRLTGSGLGCSDWPNCSGRFIEFGTPNQAMEQANRILSGLGAMVAACMAAIGARRRRPYRSDLYWLSLGLVAGVVANIPLGGITVLTGLHPASVGSHFILGMAMIAIATALHWKAGHESPTATPSSDRVLVTLSRVALVALAALMITGPVVTGSGPHAGDAEARRFGFAVPDVTRIHSLNMWVFLACVVIALARIARAPQSRDVFKRGYVLLAAIIVQGAIGYTQYELGIPAWLVILHIVGASAVVVAGVRFHLGLFDPVSQRVVPDDSSSSDYGDTSGAPLLQSVETASAR